MHRYWCLQYTHFNYSKTTGFHKNKESSVIGVQWESTCFHTTFEAGYREQAIIVSDILPAFCGLKKRIWGRKYSNFRVQRRETLVEEFNCPVVICMISTHRRTAKPFHIKAGGFSTDESSGRNNVLSSQPCRGLNMGAMPGVEILIPSYPIPRN